MRAEIVQDMPEAEYRAAPGLSQSAFKVFLESPLLFRKRLTEPAKPPTAAMKFGTLFDCVLLSRAKFISEWVDDGGRDYRTKEAKAWREGVLADGKSIYSPEDYATCETMKEAVEAHREAAKLLSGGRFQVSIFAPYTFPDGYQIQLKGRLDILPGFCDAIADVKKTVDCSPEGFGKQVNNFGHHIQAGWYPMIHNIVNGREDERKNFAIIAVQEDAFAIDGEVYGVEVFKFPKDQDEAEQIEAARGFKSKMPIWTLEKIADLISRGLEKFRFCQESGRWPGTVQEVKWVDLPTWEYRKEAA